MLKIPQKQVLNRWDSLTDNLREALCSEQNANILWAVCEREHIPKGKIYLIATLVGDVILGFSHSYDLAQEIRNELGVNPAIAEDIVSEVDRKVFTPIRADLEKVYSPAIEEAEKTEEEVLDLRGRISEIEPMAETEMPELIITETPPAGGGTDKHGLESGLTQIAEQPKIIPTGEKKPEEKKEEKAPLQSEGPLIIHKEAELKPFGESKKSLGGLFGFLRKSKTEEIKPSAVKAEVQMGLNRKPPEPPKTESIIKSSTEPIKPRPTSLASELAGGRARVVHYSEFKTPISPFPQDVKNMNADKRGLSAEIPELIITEEKPKTIPTIELLKVEQPKKIEPLVVSHVEPPENLPMVSPSVSFGTDKIEPPKTMNVESASPSKPDPFIVKRIEPAITSKFEPRIINEIKPPLARPVKPLKVDVPKPPVVNPVKPFMISGINPPAPVGIKPLVVNKVEPPVASRVEPLIKKIPEIKIEEKPSSPSRLGFFDFLKMKFRKSPKPSEKKESINQPLTKPATMSKIEPRVASPSTPLGASKVEPPAVNRVEPPKPDLIKREDDMIDLSVFK